MSLHYDVNLSLVFSELPAHERPAALARAGFDAAEWWWPFEKAVPADVEVDWFLASMDEAGVRLVAINFFAGDMACGERGVVSLPGREQEFRDSVAVLVEIARRSGARVFNALYGLRQDDVAPKDQDELAVANLAFAARAVADVDGVVVLEPLNQKENGAYPLLTVSDAIAVIDQVNAETGISNLAVLADFYHLISNGVRWQDVIDHDVRRLAHVQIADVPGRHQPGTGSVDFTELLSCLELAGYDGYVGLEYRPLGGSEESLCFLAPEIRSSRGR